jgi:hypothetical protein
MTSTVGCPDMTKNDAYPFSQAAALRPQPTTTGRSGVPPVAALSVEFVAKPQEAHRVGAAIPAAIAGALKDVTGFAGCLVMVSDQEARLVTVVTLWAGDDRVKMCGQNVRWVLALLAPYVDRCLRVQTLVAHVPSLPPSSLMPMSRPETNNACECSIMYSLLSGEENVCAA